MVILTDLQIDSRISLQDKLAEQKVIKAQEKTRNTKRRELFDAQDAIDAEREDLIKNIEMHLKHAVNTILCSQHAGRYDRKKICLQP